MDASVSPPTLYLLGILLLNYILLTCVHSQGAGDVWFSLRGTTYQNNSCVTLEDIGEGDDALFCRTNKSACCKSNSSGNDTLDWFFSNGTRISDTEGGDFNTTRGHMVIGLNRRRGGVEGIYRCEIPDSMNVVRTIYIGVYTATTSTVSTSEEATPTQTVGATTTTGTVPVTSSTTKTVGATATTGTVPVSSSIQPTKAVGATATTGTLQVSSSIQPTKAVGGPATIGTVLVSSNTQPTRTGETTATTGTVPVNSSIQSPTTTSVIIVVAVVIILVIVAGVIILVVLRAKKKQKLDINKLLNVTEDIEMKLKQEGIEEDSSSADKPTNAQIHKEAPPSVLSKPVQLAEYLN